VIINKVIEDKLESITRFARQGLQRRGLDLLGVIPYQPMLCSPTVDLVREELKAELLNQPPSLDTLVEDVVVGAMSAHNTMKFLQRGTLLITPGDREDILLAAGASLVTRGDHALAGIVLTGGFRPSGHVADIISRLKVPVLLAKKDSYRVASKVHDLTVKTRPRDFQKISLIRDVVARSVDVKKIVQAL
jgi:hypothetical protein